jgi:hypothetical protein
MGIKQFFEDSIEFDDEDDGNDEILEEVEDELV